MSSSNRVFSKIRKGSKSAAFIDEIIKGADHGLTNRVNTIGGMRSLGMKLERSCGSCAVTSIVDIDAEIAALGEDASLSELAYLCKNCGKEKVSVLPK